MNHGLHTPEQIELVYRQADAHLALGEHRLANQRFEYAFDLMRRTHGEDDLETMPALFRLATWYEKNQFPVAARSLYEHALEIRRESPELESSAPVGSSAKTIFGRDTSARAAATRCC